MPNVGEQADILRALGRLLDDQGVARGVQITNHETYLSVGWGRLEPGSQIRPFQDHDLEALREQARAMRGGSGGSTPPGSLGELLRTLGQELDEEKIEANGVSQEDDGFRITGVAAGKYVSRLYRTGDLLQSSNRRRGLRGSGSAAKPVSRTAELFSQITVGLRVFTRDGVDLGTVAELATSSFRVQDPSDELTFWLTSQRIENVQPGDWVQLSFNRPQVDQFRSWTAPEPMKPAESSNVDGAVHDGVLWRDGGKTDEGEPIVLGPFCLKDNTTLLYQPTRGTNPVPREVEPDHFVGSYTGALVCPACDAHYLLDPEGVKRVQVSRTEANLVLARARRRSAPVT